LFIDAHAHLDRYEDDEIVGVLQEIERQRILTLSVSLDAKSFLRTEAIAARLGLVVPAFGVHPFEAPRYVEALDDVEEPITRSPLIGEIGLDHRFVTDKSQYGAQRKVFARFLTRAREQKKLVNVHCVGAEQDTSDMLREHGIERAIIHWYSGPLDVLAELITAGFMFTVGVEVLHSDHIRDVARAIPREQLLTETDNPGGPRWLTGEKGYPSLISDIVAELARIRGVNPDDVLATVYANMVRLIERDAHLRPWLSQLSD
jgi:TatD DNase family protein